MTQFRRWINPPSKVSDLWLGKHCVMAAWLGLFLAVISAPHGSGFILCWFKAATGLPCPGCGLTRSLSCGIQGMFVESFHYHPMGLVILALFAFTAVQSLLPRSFRDHLTRHMQAHAAIVHWAYIIFVVAFVTFGTFRALHHWAMIWSGGILPPTVLQQASS